MSLTVDPDLCTGCRSCEIMCSFHHTGGMGTGASSIAISRSNHTAEIGWRIDSTCDLCAQEQQPLCAKYCQLGAVRVEAEGVPGPRGAGP
jgi:anaerobic carbon-monoxide dehydrogenase iron sulfur subunit